MTATAQKGGHDRRSRGDVRAVFSLVVLLIGFAGLTVASGIVDVLTRSNETVDIFNVAATVPSELLDSVEWQPDAADLHRDMEPLTRLAITDAWLRSWSQLLVVSETGRTEGLEVYFSNSALEAVEAGSLEIDGHPIRQLGHDLALHFYSEDGSVAGFESRSTRLLRRYPTATGDAWFESDESYEVVMLLEDGNWRIQHWIRRTIDGRWLSETPLEFRESPPRTLHSSWRVVALVLALLAQIGLVWHRRRRRKQRRLVTSPSGSAAQSPSFQ